MVVQTTVSCCADYWRFSSLFFPPPPLTYRCIIVLSKTMIRDHVHVSPSSLIRTSASIILYPPKYSPTFPVSRQWLTPHHPCLVPLPHLSTKGHPNRLSGALLGVEDSPHLLVPLESAYAKSSSHKGGKGKVVCDSICVLLVRFGDIPIPGEDVIDCCEVFLWQ